MMVSENLYELRKRYIDLIAQKRKIIEEAATILKSMRDICKHEYLIERDCIRCNILPTIRPQRKCLICGNIKDGWGSGYGDMAKRSETKIGNAVSITHVSLDDYKSVDWEQSLGDLSLLIEDADWLIIE